MTTPLTQIKERVEASPSLAYHFTHYKKDVLALLKMIEMKDEALKGAKRILEVYITDGSPIEDIEVADAVDDALQIGHGGEGADGVK